MTKSRAEIEEVLHDASALEEAGELDSALSLLAEAVRQTPANARLHAHRGRLYHVQKQWVQAVREFDAALAIRPEAVTTRFFRARAKSMLGDLDGALEDFEEVVRRDPTSLDASYEIALIREYRGEVRPALRALERIQERDSDFRDTAETMARLRAVLEGDA